MFRHSNWSPTCISLRDAEVQILHCTRKFETRWSKIEYLDFDVLWTHTNWTPITVPKHWLPEALKSLKNLQENLRYCLGVQRVRRSLGVSLSPLRYTQLSNWLLWFRSKYMIKMMACHQHFINTITGKRIIGF